MTQVLVFLGSSCLRRCGGGSGRRKLGRQIRRLGLKKRLELWQALELMQAQISETDAGGLRGADRVAGRVRKQYLPAVGGKADPSRGVHSDPYVSRVGQGGMPGVKPDSDPYVQVVRPNHRGNLALNRECGTQRCRGLFEDGDLDKVLQGGSGGPAAKAGIRGGSRHVSFEGQTVVSGGDVVVAVDGVRVKSADDLVRIVTNTLEPGHTAVFTVVRDGRRHSIAVRLVAR